jgi:hypothetical protein
MYWHKWGMYFIWCILLDILFHQKKYSWILKTRERPFCLSKKSKNDHFWTFSFWILNNLVICKDINNLLENTYLRMFYFLVTSAPRPDKQLQPVRPLEKAARFFYSTSLIPRVARKQQCCVVWRRKRDAPSYRLLGEIKLKHVMLSVRTLKKI